MSHLDLSMKIKNLSGFFSSVVADDFDNYHDHKYTQVDIFLWISEINTAVELLEIDSAIARADLVIFR